MAKLTNEQKFKTVEERKIAHTDYCYRMRDKCPLHDDHGTDTSCTDCAFNWLALEAEDEKLEPCPFCRSEATVGEHSPYFDVECKCGYVSTLCDTKENAIAAHNRVARAVEASKEIESEKGEVK